MRSLPGIDHDHAFGMVDEPHVGRKPLRPVLIGEDRESSSRSASPPFDLGGLDPNRTGLNGVEVHARSTTERTTSGRSKWTMCPASGTRTAMLPGAAIAAGSRSAIEGGFSASCSPNT